MFCLVLFSIYSQVHKQPDWEKSLDHILSSFSRRSVIVLTLVVGLMFLNWGIEARKWQLAVRDLQKISFMRSLKAVFSGTTLAFFTPNRVGEYFGRMLYIRQSARIASIPVTIVCSMAQLLVTCIAGLTGIIFLQEILQSQGIVTYWIRLFSYLVLIGTLVLMLLYFRLGLVVVLIRRIGWLEKFSRYLEVLKTFRTTVLLRILSLSLARYLVFVLQYYLLFQVFEVGMGWWQSLWSMSVVFLILAIVPSIAIFTDLGIRWKTSIEMVTIFSTNTLGILATSLAIWIINLVIPALLGSLLILSIRLFRRKNGN